MSLLIVGPDPLEPPDGPGGRRGTDHASAVLLGAARAASTFGRVELCLLERGAGAPPILDQVAPTHRHARHVLLHDLGADAQAVCTDLLEEADLVIAALDRSWLTSELDSISSVLDAADLLVVESRDLCDLTGTSTVRDGVAELARPGQAVAVLEPERLQAGLFLDEEAFWVPLSLVHDRLEAGDGRAVFTGALAGYLSHMDRRELPYLRQATVLAAAAVSMASRHRRLGDWRPSRDEIRLRAEEIQTVARYGAPLSAVG